jgi:hypothetical protein
MGEVIVYSGKHEAATTLQLFSACMLAIDSR